MIAYIEDRLPAAAQAVPHTRHGVAVSLLPALPEAVLDRVLLLTTEAVSRAVEATSAPWRLRVDVDDDGVLVSVRYSPGAAAPAADDDDAMRDVVLAALSSSWGIRRVGDATEIWVRVDL